MGMILGTAARMDFTPGAVTLEDGSAAGDDQAVTRSQTALTQDLRLLHQFSLRQRFSRNETIFSQGDSAKHVYKVINGTIRICKYTPDGRRQIADFMLPGDLFGFVERAEHGYSAEAATDVILLSYPREQLDRLSARTPGVVTRVLALLTEHLLSMQRQLLVLGCKNAKERFASFLVRLADRTNSLPGERIDLAMGRQDIADHLGLTIETVCRAIAELKREGSIVTPNIHQIIVSKPTALRALADGALSQI